MQLILKILHKLKSQNNSQFQRVPLTINLLKNQLGLTKIPELSKHKLLTFSTNASQVKHLLAIHCNTIMRRRQIAGGGFEPPTSRLWALRALQAALPRYCKNNYKMLINLTIFADGW